MAMATATDAEHLRASGFKRILVRLDEATRRKYCCRALEEDLQRVLGQAGACEAAMKQAQQVQDATRRLEAGPRTAAVSAGILDELDALLGKLSQATSNLGGQGPAVKQEQGGEDQDQARTLVKHILQDQDAEKASAQVKRLEKLMPVLQDRDDKQVKWWRKHVQKAVDHAVTLALQDGEQGEHAKLRLSRTVKKVAVKCPDLQDWSRTVEKKLSATREKKRGKEVDEAAPAAKSKRKRAIPLPEEDGSARTETLPATKKPTTEKDKPGESADKLRALLHRCLKEMRTLRDKFELGAYDVNLSRMVKLVDSLWPGMDQSEVHALTTALFTLVETVEKVVNVDKRRDRLVCLESVLGVVRLTDKLKLTARQKTMVGEYAANCRQSLEQLNRKSQGGKQASTATAGQAATAAPSPATASTRTAKTTPDKQTAWPKTHVRFG